MGELMGAEALPPRDKAIIVGLFLSRFDLEALRSLGFSGFRQAYNALGYAVGVLPKSVQNYRDEFDPYFPNARAGWAGRGLRSFCGEWMERTAGLDFDGFCALVRRVAGLPPAEAESLPGRGEAVPASTRLVTGRAAERYFEARWGEIDLFRGFSAQDTTSFGCGFDFLMSRGGERLFVEVKGLNGKSGGIVMTEKEYEVAREKRGSYCLFVVRNFQETPCHTLFLDPASCEGLRFCRRERTVVQAAYSAVV